MSNLKAAVFVALIAATGNFYGSHPISHIFKERLIVALNMVADM